MPNRIFTLADQIDFSMLSGDNNPLHVDPVAARRTLFGKPVVHGIHALMWALDQSLKNSTEFVRFQKLDVTFVKAIGLNEEIRLQLISEKNNRIRIDLFNNDELSVRAVCVLSTFKPNQRYEISPEKPILRPPELVDNESIRCRSGLLDMSLNPNLASQLFPNLTRHFCPLQSAILLGMSRLVGVECPGLQSIFSELRLVETNTGDLKGIKYHVAEFEDRYGLTLIAVSAPGLNGKITAFLRPVPQAQADYSIFKKLVKEDEFAGQRALIVGGSRGLGEVAAKLLAAGGADVQLTYHLGKDDAQKVTNDIISGGGHASNFSLDILQSKKDLVGAAVPTHLYYFASPIISGSGKSKFSPSLFKSYCDYYVNGFAEIVENLQRLGLRNVFYPSTVFINEMPPNFLEYVMVKNAGEVLCQGLAMKYPEMYFHCPRLPKMATDQTVSFTPSQNPTPAPIVLTALQNFRNLTPQRL